MSLDTDQKTTTDPDDSLSTYQVAIEMANNESNIIWSRFNILMVINGLILYAITARQTSYDTPMVFLFSFGGIVICFLALPFLRRSFFYQDVYATQAKIIENELHVKPEYKVMQGADNAMNARIFHHPLLT